jgi:hypothetical protein
VASLAPNTSTNVTFSVPVGDTLITNTTYASSAVFDPNLANNSSSNTNGQFTTTIIPDADLITVFTSLNQPGILVNGVITNEVTVINSGPATATNIQVKLAFAADLLYQTGAQGITNATAFWHINSLGVQASTNFLISFKATTNGIKSFVASCLASTADLQPANNNGTADASQGTVLVALPTFGSYIPTAKVNPQTGLYVETVLVTNLTQIPIPGFLAEVTKIPTGITLYNSQGTTNGYPFVTYNYPVTTGGVIPITLEFNNPKRIAFTNGLVIVPFMGSYPTNSSTTTNIIQVYYNYYTNNSYVLDFQTTPGHTYSVLYTPTYQGSNTQWKIAQPSTTATANYTIWIDSGPPNTDSKPSDSRYYELIEY